MRIAIITAMEEEMAPFRIESRITARSQVGKVIVEEAIYRDQPLILVESGIGKVNAAVSVKVSDMEGLAIVQAAAQYGIPVLAIKAVSDITGLGGDTADSFDENLDDVAKHAAHFTELLVQQILSSNV